MQGRDAVRSKRIVGVEDGHLAISHCDLSILADGLELPELKAFINRDLFDCREEVAGLISRRLATLQCEQVLSTLGALKIWCAPVNDYDTVVDDPQVRHNRNFISATSAKGTPMTLVNHPIRYDGEVAEMRIPPQPLGAQSAEILIELGWDEEAIARLVAAKVIGVPD